MADDADLRRAKRSHTLLTAELNVHGAKHQVRVRNLSQTGAFLEAPVAYNVGTSVMLCRSGTEISAVVARSDEKGLGLCFDEPLDASSFEVIRTGKAAPRTIAPLPSSPEEIDPLDAAAAPSALEASIGRELQYAQRLLDHITDPLVNDYVLISQYSRNLQEIDRLRQLLGHLANVLQASDKRSAIEGIGIIDLRCRLQGRPILNSWSDEDK